MRVGRRCETRGCGCRLPVAAHTQRRFCTRCRAAKHRGRESRRYHSDPEKAAAYNKRYRLAHLAEERERRRLWTRTHREQERETKRRYVQANYEQHRSLGSMWATNNPEKCRESLRKWRVNNPEKYAAQRKRYRDKHPNGSQDRRDWERLRIDSLIETYPHLSAFSQEEILKVLNAP